MIGPAIRGVHYNTELDHKEVNVDLTLIMVPREYFITSIIFHVSCSNHLTGGRHVITMIRVLL